MSKVVLFSNIKGGVGKTTLCAHFSEYLNEKGMSVSTADADIQASLTRHREREIEADPEHAVSWEIVKLNTLDAGKLKADMKKLRQKDGIVVIDCPGNLNDNNLAMTVRVISTTTTSPSSTHRPTLSWFRWPTMLTPSMRRASLFLSSAR